VTLSVVNEESCDKLCHLVKILLCLPPARFVGWHATAVQRAAFKAGRQDIEMSVVDSTTLRFLYGLWQHELAVITPFPRRLKAVAALEHANLRASP